jgi:hypothetical protein
MQSHHLLLRTGHRPIGRKHQYLPVYWTQQLAGRCYTADATGFFGRWSLVFSPLRDSDWINFVFNDGQGKWDNNYTKDWHYSIYCPPQDGTVTYSPEVPVGCEPITFTYKEECVLPA